ncbi:hypothetical protein [Variovorax sp. J22R115]|uniref:hypothetical protein n=1 Tax=Variovorax sp. J22R115 TaxID=3053509 RepID=UPI002574E874|nr:hypothetical protein [Variovorax sp. J22R115]MDM0049293.1 hypothetical protein [Variovorax sp. J22R115]
MQVNHLDASQFADLFTDPATKTEDMLDFEDQRTYVLTFNGLDILAIGTPDGGATVIYPCSSFDAESGGSIHDHARAINRADGSGT